MRKLALGLSLLATAWSSGSGCARHDAEPRPTPSSTPKLAPPSQPQTILTGVSDTEIIVGQPAGFTGPSAGLGVEMWRGAAAAFSVANEQGIHGRKIRLVLADDGYDAERAASAVVNLLERQHAFLLFGGVGTPTIVRALPVVRKYHDETGLFYFANFTGAQPQRREPYAVSVFNVRASYYEETRAMVDAYVASGKNHIGTFVQDDAYGTDGREGTRRALRDRGLEPVADATYPRGQKFEVSTATQVKLLRNAGVDAIVMVGSYQACGAFIRDARNSGWDVPIHNVSFVGADQMLELLKGAEAKGGKRIISRIVNTQVVPYYEDLSIPAVRAYHAAIDKYAPTAPPEASDGSYHVTHKYSFGSLEGYISARALIMVLERTGRDLNRRTAYAAAEGMGEFDLGLGVPAKLSPERHQALDRVWFTYATPEGWKPIEKPASILK